MSQTMLARATLGLLLAGTLLAAPADAQGKGEGKGNERKELNKARPELVRREDQSDRERALREEQRRREEYRRRQEEQRDVYDRRRDSDYDRYEGYERSGDRRVPPGWCKGKGNPHNTPENCGYSASRNGDDRLYDRRGASTSRSGTGTYGSYEREHDEFHRWHDRQCREQAAERPLDIQWQLRVRQECKAKHDDWHYRMGRRHE